MIKKIILLSILTLLSVSLTYTLNNTPNLAGNLEEFKANDVKPGNKSSYRLNMKMDEHENFYVDADIEITNTSSDQWDNIVMYFIPNMFTKKNAPSLECPATIKIISVAVNHVTSSYSLIEDTLTVPLYKDLDPDKSVKVNITYEFTMPLEGLRFTKKDSNFHLAQWYPLVPTYQDGWNKHEYRPKGETYHTGFNDYHVKVEVPPQYTIVTSGEDEHFQKQNIVEIEAKTLKEFFVALLKDPIVIEKKVSDIGVNIRVFGEKGEDAKSTEILSEAIKAIGFFSKAFGPYSSDELDIIIGGLGMEYPHVVTVGSIYNSAPVSLDTLKRMVVHEVAHQWFYGTVSNDPFQDAWLDEGLAQLSSHLYDMNKEDLESFDFDVNWGKKYPEPVNLPLNQYALNEQSIYIYGKSTTQLAQFFNKHGGADSAKNFLKEYVRTYRNKQVDTKEFVDFANHYFDLKTDDEFKGWLQLD